MTEQDQQVQEQTAPDEASNNTEQQTQEGVYRSQEEFDAAFSKRLERERKKLREEIQKEADEAAKKAKMDEAERLKAEKEEVENNAKARESAANQRIVRAEAKVQAASLGVKPERVKTVLKLTDLSDVEVGDDGEPDADALRQAIEATINEYPEFKTGGTNVGGSGSNPANGGGNDPEKNPWSDEHFNLMEQGNIYRKDPEKAKRLANAAGKSL